MKERMGLVQHAHRVIVSCVIGVVGCSLFYDSPPLFVIILTVNGHVHSIGSLRVGS